MAETPAVPPLSVLRTRALRYVEQQSQIASSELVDTEAEQLRLEELLEAHKPALTAELRRLHWLLRSAFRYPPLRYGSRFGTAQERGILYLSESRNALEHEMAFYTFKFFEAQATPPPNPLRRAFSVVRVQVRSDRAVDLKTLPSRKLRPLIDPNQWAHGQAFGRTAREAQVDVIRYPSARIAWPEALSHCNLAVMAPVAVQGNRRLSEVGAYTALTDASGVRLQGMDKATRYFKAEQLAGGPF